MEEINIVFANNSHKEFLMKLFNDKKISLYMEMDSEKYTLKEMDEYIQDNDEIKFVAMFENTPVGFGSIYDIDENQKRAEISFAVDSNFQGKKIGTKILNKLLEHAFLDLKLNSLFATVSVPNTPSIRVLEKSGFQKIGIRREYSKIKNEFVDEIFFDILKKDFVNKKND